MLPFNQNQSKCQKLVLKYYKNKKKNLTYLIYCNHLLHNKYWTKDNFSSSTAKNIVKH